MSWNHPDQQVRAKWIAQQQEAERPLIEWYNKVMGKGNIMGEGTVVVDSNKRLQALADRVYRLECKVASLEWYKEHKTDGAIAYTAAKEERAIFQHFEKVAKEDDGD